MTHNTAARKNWRSFLIRANFMLLIPNLGHTVLKEKEKNPTAMLPTMGEVGQWTCRSVEQEGKKKR
jgi:hypothetical protein